MCNLENIYQEKKKERKKERNRLREQTYGYQGRRVKRKGSEGSLDPLT